MKRYTLPGLGLDLGLDRDLSGILANGQAEVSTLAAYDALYRRTVVFHRPTPTSFVGPAPRWGVRVQVRGTLLSRVLKHFRFTRFLGFHPFADMSDARTPGFIAVSDEAIIIPLAKH